MAGGAALGVAAGANAMAALPVVFDFSRFHPVMGPVAATGLWFLDLAQMETLAAASHLPNGNVFAATMRGLLDGTADGPPLNPARQDALERVCANLLNARWYAPPPVALVQQALAPGNGPAAPHVQLVAAAPHVPMALSLLRDRSTCFAGMFPPGMLNVVTTALGRGSVQMAEQELLQYLSDNGFPEHTVKSTDVMDLFFGSFFTVTGLSPAAAMKLQALLRPRVVFSPIWDAAAARDFVARLFAQLINPVVGNLLTDSVSGLIQARETYTPQLTVNMEQLNELMIRDCFLPSLRMSSTQDNPAAARILEKVGTFLERGNFTATAHELQTNAIMCRLAAVEARSGAGPPGQGVRPPRNPVSSALAVATSSGVTSNPPPAPLRPAPPGRTLPPRPSGPCGPCPLTPTGGQQLCYGFNATGGHCPYSRCNNLNGHIPAVGTPAALALYDAWLPLWLANAKWTAYKNWSARNSSDAEWPRICN